MIAIAILWGGELRGAEGSEIERELRELRQQNKALQDELRQQGSLVEALSRKVTEIQNANAAASREATRVDPEINGSQNSKGSALSLGKVNISGEGGVGFFESGSEGLFPHAAFRVDEAKIFVEAPIWGDVYFFGELNLMTREAPDLSLQLGELYLDVENISQLWNHDHMLNLRLGRMYTPFGEEYQSRYAIDNSFISHSLSDIWGVDEGIELYGRIGKLRYAAAVQNGGPSGVQDFSSDKSVAGRIGFDPASWLHLSASGMRTGELKPPGDYWSEVYFGNAWFLPFGSDKTTAFHANLFEGDVEIRLPRGHIKAFGGYARYDDNDPSADNRRDIFYYSIEAVHDLTHKLYGGVRFSQILADKGFPIAGNGNQDNYVFSGTLTEEIWRLSLALGYRWSQNLVTKAEYTFEHGKEVGGEKRDHEDLFSIEAAFKF